MSLGLWIVGVCSGVLVLVLLVAAVWTGIAALGTPRDRAAANETLRRAAALLGARFRERRDYPWYRRPPQYGAIEGDLGQLGYQLLLLPWNVEDHGGCAMVVIRSRHGRPVASGQVETIVTAREAWHWPDRGDPAGLAEHVRQIVAAAESREPGAT